MGDQIVRPKLDDMFDDKIECRLSGTISMVVAREWGKILYVKDNRIYLNDEQAFLSKNDGQVSPSENDEQAFLSEKVIVYISDNQDYLVGNSITVFGEIQKFSKATNPGQFNEYMYYNIENIDYKMKAEHIHINDSNYSKFHKILYTLKQKMMEVYSTILEGKESGSLIAMLLGDKYLLDDELKVLYQENGISHILSISGLHISLIGMCIFKMLRKLKLPLVISTVISILLIYSYGVFTNFGVSTNRAVVMLIVNLMAKIFGRTYDMLSATALSAFLILLNSPMQIFSVGFQLSFAAVIGIAILIPSMKEIFPSDNVVLNNIYVSLSAQLMTMPLILFYFYQLPIYSLFINLLLIPFMSLLIISSLIAGIAGMIYLPLGIFLIGGANYILRLYEVFCRLGSSLPGNLLTIGQPSIFKITVYYIFIFIFVWGVKRYSNNKASLALILGTILLILPGSIAGVQITMLDVGQGEAIFIETETGSTYLIDGGSTDIKKVGEYRIIPFLLSQGVDQIDYSIITHSDSDHISGVLEILQSSKIKIHHMILPNISDRNDNYINLMTMAEDKGVNILFIEEGNWISDGDVHITCLHPASTFRSSSNNSYSTVLRLKYGDFDMLLTGDLEADGERVLLEKLKGVNSMEVQPKAGQPEGKLPVEEVDYDILKVAHHGARSSTSEDLLSIIRPEVAIISCGKNNPYGHPHEELLERLHNNGVEVKVTTKSGAITIRTDGRRMVVEDFR